jgi:hypothetical protein
MADIAELERRITAALERIGRGLDGLARPVARSGPPDHAAGAVPQDDVLVAQLQAERAAVGELREALRASADREMVIQSQYEERIEKLTRQLDVQGLELQRMRKTSVTLREELRRLRETAVTGLAEPGQINRAMLTELDAMRAARLSEMAELDEIAAALDEHLTEAENA